ncbi:MAG TPA: malonyl-CoA decarboxylase, partial [Magnetovibrio sp.]
QALDDAGRLSFFQMLLNDYGPDMQTLDRAVQAYQKAPGQETAFALALAAEPGRQGLIRAINMAPGGTAAVVAMRKQLLGLLRAHPELVPVEADFAHLLNSWFNRGFLTLEQIDWRTPAMVLEKIISYEAVHEIQGWDDLRRRLAEDRRCFAFFHPALPEEPLIFVEVALLNGIADKVQPLLELDGAIGDAAKADTAIFYSISNCQEGLKGISFGNFLIKQVVAHLRQDLPNVKTFATLSPIPGFGAWLAAARANGDPVLGDLPENPPLNEESDFKDDLVRLAAHYLVHEKSKGRPLDAVARFHLGNGARIERINWMGDTSERALRQSSGMLVNYLYDLRKIENYHEAFVNEGVVACSKSVQNLL